MSVEQRLATEPRNIEEWFDKLERFDNRKAAEMTIWQKLESLPLPDAECKEREVYKAKHYSIRETLALRDISSDMSRPI